ncbi:DNA-3-methyladenine glycosylase I [Sessilibacter corallicola]|uniref:DNA-3-methyladenine glycosylase I n=1 Tax=Sessilibacter corallicola TaxID=2904075 RepID=A0ABQ0A4C6_9GAMM|nr:DNA-3-methyladenine glycosylase I [Sessilibacter corallicola]MCE2026887.1 DNA-3-methyladenine glycosylase I [Sessilibacter corallicola]
MTDQFTAPDGKVRCKWCNVPEFLDYHDKEWGFPVKDDRVLFEKLCLESFQAGLSWRTILNKRENFRKAFKNFEIDKVARFNRKHVENLLENEGIIRHRGKIEAVINNAKCAQKIINEHGSLAKFFWSFEPRPENLPEPLTASTSKESELLSKTLKKSGWKFVGPTTVYSFMQAMGMINDHAHDCVIREKVLKARKKFKTPK